MRGSWLQLSVSGAPYSDFSLAARHSFGVGIRPNSEASHRVREKTSVIQGKFVLVVIPQQEFRLCG